MESREIKKKNDEYTFFKLNNMLNTPTNDGKIQLGKDKEAVKAYFLEYVNPNTVFFHNLKEKLDYLIENEYIDGKLFEMYDFGFIKSVFEFIYSKKFRFDTFMGAYKFYSQYAMKTNDGKRFLERYEDRLAFNALFLANGDKELCMNLADELINRRFQPATPTFLNIGKKRSGELVSCFLLDIDDTLNAIGRAINSALQLSKIGGGVALNLSNIRAKGDPIKQVENMSDGIVPIMKLLEDSFSYANQLGQRDGSGAVYLNVFHMDIVDFLSTRKENADEKVRIKTLSLGITVPDKFYQLCKEDKHMYLFSPYDVERTYGVPFSYVDITKEYDNMVQNDNIRKKKIRARDLETEISNIQNESGYPYILNIDTANNENPVHGKVVMSNLCVTGDTMLLTKDGYIRADELYKLNKKLNVVIDKRTINMDVYENGKEIVKADKMYLTARDADVYKVRLKDGKSIKSTLWHKYYVKKDDNIIKISLIDCNVGDFLLTENGETSEIISIEYYGNEDVYDTTQHDYHSLIFNGIVTGNCTEILQTHETSVINDNQTYQHLGHDVSCNLGSTNVVNLMDSPDFGKSVKTMLHALNYVTENSSIESVPSIKNGNDKYRAVGLGAMNLHGFLAKNHIHYGSDEAIEFTDFYFMLLNYWTLVESNNISIISGEKFHDFDKSKYATGEYFNKYTETEMVFKYDKVKKLFENHFIPTTKEWGELKENVMKYGLYNSFRLTTAPTGSISYINEASSSIHPITTRIEERTEGKRGRVYYPAPYLNDETIKYYTSAYDIDQRKMIDMYAVAQKHTDQSLSMTLFTRSEFKDGLYEWKDGTKFPTKKTTRDLNILRNYAWKKGIKTIYYVRTYTETDEVIGSSQCESCSV